MGCQASVVQELCELYPKTGENLRMRGLEKRAVFLYYMGEPTSVLDSYMKHTSVISPGRIQSKWAGLQHQPCFSEVLKIVPND